MSELDVGRRADAQPVSTSPLGKLRSITSPARLGQQPSEGLEDLFAQVFAHIAQSRPSEPVDAEPGNDSVNQLEITEPESAEGPRESSVEERADQPQQNLSDREQVEHGIETGFEQQEAIEEPVTVQSTRGETDTAPDSQPIEAPDETIEVEAVEEIATNPVVQTTDQQETGERRRRGKGEVKVDPKNSVEGDVTPVESRSSQDQAKLTAPVDEPLHAETQQELGENFAPNEKPKRSRNRHKADANAVVRDSDQQAKAADDALLRAIAAQKGTESTPSSAQASIQATAAAGAERASQIAQPGAAVSQASTTVLQNASQSGTAPQSSANAKSIQALEGPNGLTPTKERPSGKAKNASNAETVSRVKLIQRVSKAFHHLGPDGGTVRLRLAPAELGSVRVEMRIQQRSVQARVVAETEAASNALREHLPELRQRLESQGLQIERLDVETETSDRDSSSHRHGNDERQSRGNWQHQDGRNHTPLRLAQTRSESSSVSNAPVSPTVSRFAHQPSSSQGVDLTF